MQKQKQKRWSNSLIESANLGAGVLLIFSVSFQFDHVPLLGNEKSHAILVKSRPDKQIIPKLVNLLRDLDLSDIIGILL